MSRWITRDTAAGVLMTGLGLWFALQAYFAYPLGSFRHMGPGMFPALLGATLTVIGLLVLIPALLVAGPRIPIQKPEWRPLFFVLLALLAFALTIRMFGLVPAIVLLTIAAVLADDKLRVLGTLVLVAALVAIGVLVFKTGLGIPLETIRWPFR